MGSEEVRAIQTQITPCDIGGRYHPVTPQPTLEELTGWNPNTLFLDFMNKVREKRERDLDEAEEDALMAMIDAMNVSQRDRESGRARETAEEILLKASQTIGEKTGGKGNPADTLTVQVLLSCLGDRFTFDQADELTEQDRAEEEQQTEEVTQTEQPQDIERR